MKLPRDIDAGTLIRALQRIGYRVVRQTGSHIRRSYEAPNPHAFTLPAHSPLKIGTLAAILSDVATQRGMTRDALMRQLFDA